MIDMGIEDDLFSALERFNHCHEQCHHELSQEINISELKVKQLHYLEIIHRHTPLAHSQLADILGITRPSVTSIVNRLVKLDCVLKRQCTRDGRKFYVELSEKGKRIVAFKQIKYQRLAKKIVVSLSVSEIRTLITLLQKITNI
jgi:DNA-binding MarR family transcriptional regulator